jgi:hypothetical protein
MSISSRSARFSHVAVAHLDVLDSDTTHFDCLIEIRGREKREALESCRVCCDPTCERLRLPILRSHNARLASVGHMMCGSSQLRSVAHSRLREHHHSALLNVSHVVHDMFDHNNASCSTRTDGAKGLYTDQVGTYGDLIEAVLPSPGMCI